ncbi:MAG: hypothetical protein HC893_07875 [Chloroflexaceae bacterium]|nr:hypothetical protein [Chloroflexaceae bacterium]
MTVTPFEQGVYELESASVTVAVTPAPIAALDVSSADLSLPADGVSSTTITAEATDVYGNSIEGAEVTFSTTAGTLRPADGNHQQHRYCNHHADGRYSTRCCHCHRNSR